MISQQKEPGFDGADNKVAKARDREPGDFKVGKILQIEDVYSIPNQGSCLRKPSAGTVINNLRKYVDDLVKTKRRLAPQEIEALRQILERLTTLNMDLYTNSTIGLPPPMLKIEKFLCVEITKQQTRSRLLEFMRTHMGFLPEDTIANLAAQISPASREQLTQ